MTVDMNRSTAPWQCVWEFNQESPVQLKGKELWDVMLRMNYSHLN